MIRKAVTGVIIFTLVFGCAGCSPYWKKKFIRPKKGKAKQTAIIQAQDYEKPLNVAAYDRSYLFWKTMHADLLDRFGNNNKNDIFALTRMKSNLSEMRNLLVEEKAAQIGPHIAKIDDIMQKMKVRAISENLRDRIKHDLERQMRRIMREFSPEKVSELIKPDEGASKDAVAGAAAGPAVLEGEGALTDSAVLQEEDDIK